MGLFPTSLSSGQTWWWAFGLLIVVPALILAVLGLWAVRAERLEQEQQLRERQAQVARLADGALENLLTGLEDRLRRLETKRPDETPGAEDLLSDHPVFSFNRRGLLTFFRERVYAGPFGQRPDVVSARSNWPGATQRLIDQARAAEAQGRWSDAHALYRRIRRVAPTLRAWVEFSLARLRSRQSDPSTLAVPAAVSDSGSAALTPGGFPVALLVSAEIGRLPAEERTRHAFFFESTLKRLRSGRWWLSDAQRRHYDRMLRRLLPSTETGRSLSPDPRLRELATVERAVRQFPPHRRDRVTKGLVHVEDSTFFVLWVPSRQDAETWMGAALPESRLRALLDQSLGPLLAGQPFEAELRDRQNSSLWGGLPPDTAAMQTVSLRAMPGWELAFSPRTQERGTRARRLLWYGFIGLLVVMLGTGLAMTVRVVRREVELSRRQQEFISAVSHEFKSPIAGIRLLLERLSGLRPPSSEQAETYRATIYQELDRLERLVDRLLTAQRIQTGRARYTFEPTSLVEVARNAVDLLQPQAEAKSIDLDLQAEEDVPQVPADGAVLTDALENLLDNAIKYSPPETRVTVRIGQTDGQVQVDVEDQGVGVDPDEQDRIFDRFYRGQRGDRHDVRGTGLGLALVKAAAEAHEGTIEVDSTPGEGSCFSLRLPGNNPDPDSHGTDSDRG